MLNSLFQIQISDPGSIPAYAGTIIGNVVTGIMSVIACILFIYRWRHEVLRIALVGWMLSISVYSLIGYGLVIFVDPTPVPAYAGNTGADVALLRPVLAGWHIAAVGICLLLHMIQSYDPAELAQQRIHQLEHEARGHRQSIKILEGSNERLQAREKKAEEAAVSFQQVIKKQEAAIAKVRADSAAVFEQKMELEAKALQQEEAVNALKRQVIMMEVELRQVKGRS